MEQKNTALVEIITANGIELTEAESIVTSFGVFMQDAEKLVEEGNLIKVMDENDQTNMDSARTVRLSLKRIRNESEKARKGFKEDYLKRGRAIDQIAKKVADIIEPVEEYLEGQEKFALNAAITRKTEKEKARFDERVERLKPYLLPNTDMANIFGLKDMPDTSFETLIISHKASFEAHTAKVEQEAKEKAEFERLQKEEQERIRIENEKLKQEKVERDEKDRIERDANELRLREEREAREKVEKELKAKENAERAEKERVEKERLAKEENERQAQLAPDKEKLEKYSDEIRSIAIPVGLSKKAQVIAMKVNNQLFDLSITLEHEIAKL